MPPKTLNRICPGKIDNKNNKDGKEPCWRQGISSLGGFCQFHGASKKEKKKSNKGKDKKYSYSSDDEDGLLTNGNTEPSKLTPQLRRELRKQRKAQRKNQNQNSDPDNTNVK